MLLGLLLLSALGGGGFYYLYNRRLTAFAEAPYGQDSTRVVDIPQGTGPRKLANLLEEAGVISSAESFYGYLRREKLGPRLKAGEYEFKGPRTPLEIIGKLVAGEVKVYRFTVREGLRVDETLPILASSELRLDLSTLEKLVRTNAFVRQLGVPADSIEGFLYPDTYAFTRGTTEEQVLRRMVSRALEEYQKASRAAPAEHPLTLLETMTLASIVEKETGAPQERPRISCVFHNRLKQGMRLQTDPTVLYAMMLSRGRFIKNISRADLQTDHPYNTYTRHGLPPGPIASPGAAAMVAAFNPIACLDLFFVSRNDGTHLFCPDLKCHEAAVRTWQVEFFRKKRVRRN